MFVYSCFWICLFLIPCGAKNSILECACVRGISGNQKEYFEKNSKNSAQK
jgi:hypothetical protein